MIKALLLLSIIFCSLLAFSQDTTAILSKAPVLKASEKEMLEAKDNTQRLLKDVAQHDGFFGQFVIIGGKLWNELKDQAPFKEAELTNVTFRLPVLDEKGNQVSKKDVIGKAIQERPFHTQFWNYIHNAYALGAGNLSEMTNRDKFIYWLYFAKIEEPTIIIQTEKGRLLLKFVQGKLFFIELM
jgi:hypothetical protein